MRRSVRRKRRPARRQVAMRITEARREQIEKLAAALAAIAPSTAPGSGFCVRKVARELGLKECWKKQRNKHADIAHLLENVLRRYPRKPKALVLAIVRGGVEWMARKGRRVTHEHLAAVAGPMEALGFRIRKELEAIEIPEPCRVRRPAQDLAALFDRLDLHDALKDDIAQMFREGHFNEAVRKALERFEKRIQDEIGDRKSIGKNLMAKACNRDKPLIPINALQSGNDLSEQEGFMHLTMGAMAGLRNLYSHGDVGQMSATDAIERLAFVSLLFKRVDRALTERTQSK